MLNHNNKKEFKVKLMLYGFKTFITQHFQRRKNWIILHQIEILKELKMLIFFVLIAVVILQYVQIVDIVQKNNTINSSLIEKNQALEKMDTSYNQLLKEKEELKVEIKNKEKEILEQEKTIKEKNKIIKDIKNSPIIMGEKLTSDESQVSRRGSPLSNQTKEEWLIFEATAYTKECNGCSGITKGGTNLNKLNYTPKIIAADPKKLPLGTKVEIGGMGIYLVDDIGGDIKGNRIDILYPDRTKAYEFGRKSVRLRVLE